MLRAHQLETPECLWSRLPLPEVGCAASVSLQAQGRRFAEITVAVPISNRRCVLGNQTLTMLPLYLLKMSRLFFFFSYWRGKKSLSRNYTFKSCVYQRNRKDTICRTYYSLLHISFSATVNSLLTAGTEESENGTGKKAAGFVLKSPLERLPVSYRCASMGAGRAAPSLGARLHCSAFWSSLVTRLPAFIMSLGLDGTCKVCDNKNLGRGRQSNQVTVRGIHFKTKNKSPHWKCWAMFVYWL